MSKTSYPLRPEAERLLQGLQYGLGKLTMDRGKTYRPAMSAEFRHIEGFPPSEVNLGLRGERVMIVGYTKKARKGGLLHVYSGYGEDSWAGRFGGIYTNFHYEKERDIPESEALEAFPGLRRQIEQAASRVASTVESQRLKMLKDPEEIIREALGFASGEGVLSRERRDIALQWLENLADPDRRDPD